MAVNQNGNTLEARAAKFLKRIENCNGDLDSMRGEYMADCKHVRAQIKDIYAEAKDAGVSPRALKGLVKHRQLTRKQERIAADMDETDDAAAYAELIDKLGPLGLAAAQAHGYAAGDEQHATA